jgi:transporter family protein
MSSKILYISFALLSAITASLVAIFGKLGLKNVDPTLATTIRAIIMAGFLVLTSLSLGKLTNISLSTLSSQDWKWIVLSGIFGALSWLFYFWALKFGPATNVAVIDRLSLVFVLLFSVFILGETLNWKAILGITCVIVGAILIVLR